MPIPQDHVAQVAAFLTGGSGTPKEKLITGGKMLWAATVLGGGWTPELLAKARRSMEVLTRGTKIEYTVGRMDDATAGKCLKQFAKEVTDLSVEIAQVRDRKRAAAR